MALRRQNERGKGASEVPGAPIKVEIVGFVNVNPTSRRRGLATVWYRRKLKSDRQNDGGRKEEKLRRWGKEICP